MRKKININELSEFDKRYFFNNSFQFSLKDENGKDRKSLFDGKIKNLSNSNRAIFDTITAITNNLIVELDKKKIKTLVTYDINSYVMCSIEDKLEVINELMIILRKFVYEEDLKINF
jgi:uncharacterized protein YacL (UPF0231 family)